MEVILKLTREGSKKKPREAPRREAYAAVVLAQDEKRGGVHYPCKVHLYYSDRKSLLFPFIL